MPGSQGIPASETQLLVENLPADSTHKTVWVIGFAQCWDHFSLNEFITTEASCAIESLVVQSTDVVSLSHKKSSLSQVTSTSCGKKKGRLRRQETNALRLGWFFTCDLNGSYGAFKHFSAWAYDHRTDVHLKDTTLTVNYISHVFWTRTTWTYLA